MRKVKQSNLKPQDVVSVQVSNDLTVQVIPFDKHEFLMTVDDVAKGYGTSGGTIRKNLFDNKNELKENTHFVRGVTICNTLGIKGIQPHQIFWTKAGVVRLGMFIKSERARLFRDWAEKVILKSIATPKPMASLPPVAKRKHIRISPPKMVELLKDICQVEPKELRMSIISKLQ